MAIQPKWYMIQVMVGREAAIKRQIEERLSDSPVSENLGEVRIPKYSGYLLVRCILSQDVWHCVKDSGGNWMGGRFPRPIRMSDVLKSLP